MLQRIPNRPCSGATLAPEYRNGELDHCEGRLEMAVEHRVPLLFTKFVDWVPRSQARIVDQDIQTAEELNRGLDRALCSFECGDAVGCVDGFAARCRYHVSHP